MRELQKGEVVGGFVVKERIGQGGMGDVYLVRDEPLAVDRALKVISLSGPGFTGSKSEAAEYRERFQREARTLARLRHPNIIAVHATGEVDGNPFLVMSHFPSVDGRLWLNEQKPTLERVRHVALQIARALSHAHESGVLHRDIKLANMLIGKDDEAMLIDFGLAKSAVDGDLTRVGRTMGTFSYLAPEYVRASTVGKQKHTVATDLWAMGCLLYAMTCREAAFHDKDENQLLRAIARAQFAPVRQRAPGAPDTWSTLIHQLMEPDPDRRLPSAAELVARIESIDLRPPSEVPKPPPPRDVHEEFVAPPAVPEAAGAPLPAEAAPPARAPVEGAVDGGARVVTKETDGSIFDHADEATGATGEASGILAQPSFQLPPERATSGRLSARKKLVLPIAAAVLVLAAGAGIIVAIGHLGGRARSTAYVDPEELQRRQRGSTELEELSAEKTRRAASMKYLDVAPLPAASTPVAPQAAEAMSAAHGDASAPHAHARHASSPAQASAPARETNPWIERYGTRASYNTSSGASVAAAAVSPTSDRAAAGTRIPVRVTNAVASAPLGPVIAVVQATTKLGAVELPRGSEIHGRVTGAEGPRILLEFTFALVNGRSVTLKGIALGEDGRAGVLGAKNIGGVSDIGAGAATGGAQALLDGAASIVGNDVAAGALRGATAPIVNKADRLNNEEDLVVADRGSKFFIYVESVL